MKLIDILPTTNLWKRDAESLADYGSLSAKLLCIPDGRILTELLHETGEFFKNITCSTGYILYVYDEVNEEISFHPKEGIKAPNECSYASWKLDNEKTLAVYVFKNKRTVKVDYTKPSIEDIFLESYQLLDISCLQPRHILALPIVNSAGRCFGVIELYKDSIQSYSDEADVAPCEFFLKLCAEVLTFNESAIFYQCCNQLQDVFLKIIKLDQCKTSKLRLEDGKDFLSEFSSAAQKVFGVKSVAIYIEKNSELVCINKTVEETLDEYNNDTFVRKPIIRTQLAEPFERTFGGIADNVQRGFIYLYNKQYITKEFTRTDRDCLKLIAKSASLWMYLENIRGIFKEQDIYNSLILDIIDWELENAESYPDPFVKLVPIPEAENFNKLFEFDYMPNLSNVSALTICSLCYGIIWETVRHSQESFPERLRKFIKMLQISHHSCDPVHNLISAFFDAHAAFCLLSTTEKLFTEHEKLAILLALLCGQIAISFQTRSYKPSKHCQIMEDTGRTNYLLQHDCNDAIKRFWVAKILFEHSQLLEAGDTLEMIEELMTTPIEFFKKLKPINIEDYKSENGKESQKMLRLLFYRFGRLFGSIKSGLSANVDYRAETFSCVELLKPFCPHGALISVQDIIFNKMFNE